ncbi:MAG: hypothetical protein ACJAT7_002602, partial [Psychromonas sp.]
MKKKVPLTRESLRKIFEMGVPPGKNQLDYS